MNEVVLCNRADGVDGHYCLGRKTEQGYYEYYNKGKWVSAGEVFTAENIENLFVARERAEVERNLPRRSHQYRDKLLVSTSLAEKLAVHPSFIPLQGSSDHPDFFGGVGGRWRVYEVASLAPGQWFHMTLNAWDWAADMQTTEPRIVWLTLKNQFPGIFDQPPLNNIGEVDYLNRWIDPALPEPVHEGHDGC